MNWRRPFAPRENADAASQWQYVGTTIDPALAGKPFLIDGIDVWACEWEREEGINPEVRDPIYCAPQILSVYTATQNGRTIQFGATEFSMGVWGFYTPPRSER